MDIRENKTFKWVDSIAEAADMINLPHKASPMRIPATHLAIEQEEFSIDCKDLLKTHKKVFGDTLHGGNFRKVNVRVGSHVAPEYSQVPALMKELYDVHNPLLYFTGTRYPAQTRPYYEEILIDWYTDFKIIHPFQDGNGIVGGIVVAQYSHLWFPDKGWMASQQ